MNLGLSLMICGCSELIPGLNVDEGASGGHSYHVVESKQAEDGYTLVPGQAQPKYEVIPITPELIAKLGTEAGTYIPEGARLDSTLKSLDFAGVPPEYQIGAGDVLFVTIWDHPELTVPAGNLGSTGDPSAQGRLVAADGTIFYPYVGTFSVLGQTVEQVRSYIDQHIARIIPQPQVDVRVIAFRSQRVQVTGEVKKPGTVILNDSPKGILQAIDEAGGLSDTASRRRIILVRDSKTYTIDFAGLLSGRRSAPNIALLPGDEIRVPDQSGDQVFVLGEVIKQQPLPILQGSMSLIQALTSANGLDKLSAKDSGVLVFRLSRQTEDGEAKVYTLDMSNPQGILLAGEFSLQPRDVVYVKATAFARYNSVINQILPTAETLFYLIESNQATK